ncbi:MAG: SAM-dependent methyltransferase [Gammaproteobacteria bacterium]|nr:MAG: SAM-dependent methyltransferase [Gammaproteobacteria bacterium]
MAHGYRTLQHWNHWLAHEFLGHNLLESEQQLLSRLLNNHFGKQAVLLGVPQQYALLNTTPVVCHSLLTPIIHNEKNSHYIEGDFHELPILTGSMDLVLLPHTLEFVDHPRQLLSEACRIVKPEGLIVITGFNPYSAWGVKKIWSKHKISPSSGHFLQASHLKRWLQLADFALEKQKYTLFRPPINHPTLYQKLHFLESIGSMCLPFLGGVYILLARAKVIPLTPIRLKWTQQLSGIRISTTIPGNIARQSK